MVNFKNIRWRTALHWSTSYAGYEGFENCEEISYFLARNGGDINQKNKDLMTPFVSITLLLSQILNEIF